MRPYPQLAPHRLALPAPPVPDPVVPHAPLPASNRLRAREDLYHRLAQFTLEVLEVPPLRDRGADVAELAQRFVEEFSSEHDTPRVLDKGAVARLSSYAWPGNVRELRNTMLRAVQLSTAPTITAADLASASPRGGEPPASMCSGAPRCP